MTTVTQNQAMKLALEALEPVSTYGRVGSRDVDTAKSQQAITALQKALAEQQQEPVAWAISYDGKTPYAIWSDGDGALLDLEVKRQGGTTCKLPLYTSPPARKPLTDEEIRAIVRKVDEEEGHVIHFARAIEAAHGIK